MMTQRIIEHHDGRLDFESAPGQGTVTTITLPAVDATANPRIRPVPRGPPSPRVQSLRRRKGSGS